MSHFHWATSHLAVNHCIPTLSIPGSHLGRRNAQQFCKNDEKEILWNILILIKRRTLGLLRQNTPKAVFFSDNEKQVKIYWCWESTFSFLALSSLNSFFVPTTFAVVLQCLQACTWHCLRGYFFFFSTFCLAAIYLPNCEEKTAFFSWNGDTLFCLERCPRGRVCWHDAEPGTKA